MSAFISGRPMSNVTLQSLPRPPSFGRLSVDLVNSTEWISRHGRGEAEWAAPHLFLAGLLGPGQHFFGAPGSD